MGLYLGNKIITPSIVSQGSGGGGTITALNNTGSAVVKDDKVWVETESKNFTIVGSPTIANKVASNFSDANYLQVSQMANTTSGTWTFDVEFIYVTNPYPPAASDPQPIIYFTDSGGDNRGVFVVEGLIQGTIPSTNSDGYESLKSSTALTSGETYHLQIELTANSGKIYIKHNGSIIETLSGQNGTYMPASITGFILGADGWYDEYFAGSIDLNNTNIKINNSTAWSPYSPAHPYYLINFTDVSSSTITGIAKENIAISGTGDVVIGTVVEPDLGTKTITVNGTYNASSDNLDGFSSVTVDVPSAPTKKYNLLDRVKDDSNYEIGTVSGFFTDANNVEYAVVCLDARFRLASGQYLNRQVAITGLSLYSNLDFLETKETATLNTTAILNMSGYTSNSCDHCRLFSATIDGTTYYGQLPNIVELIDIFKNRTAINTADTSASSYSSLILANNKNVWSSTQYYANGYTLSGNGLVSYSTKSNNNFVIPVLEIPNT